jgi:hypothetical protein
VNETINPVIKQATVDQALMTGPGEDLVLKTLLQLSSIPGFVKIFGPYSPPTGNVKDDLQRWADYQRFDWSIRQLPAINVFESQRESKDSDNAFLRGTVSFQVFWPPSMRRPDSRRVDAAFKGALENFFASEYVTAMLDELYYIQRPAKVYGLNEYGKTLTWTPNINGLVESGEVPTTIIDADYRIDLRAWYRALEFMSRTKDQPFLDTLVDLVSIGSSADAPPSGYDGVINGDVDGGTVEVTVEDEIAVNNP